MRVLVIALVLFAVAPAAARADTYTAGADSPRDSSLPVGRDISNVEATFDDVAGTLTIALRLPGVPETAGSASINATLDDTAADGTCGSVIAYLRSTTNPASGEASGTVAIVLSPFSRAASGTVTVRAHGKTIGRRAFSAKANAAVTVRVKLNASSRRALARGKSLSVRMTASARAGADTASRTTTARVQRTRTRTRGE